MNCRVLLLPLVFIASLCFTSMASATPLDYGPPYTSPTYLVFAGDDTFNTLRYATIYFDPSSWQGGVDSRSCYARYESGNLFGNLTKLDGWAVDYFWFKDNNYGEDGGKGGYIGISGIPEGILGNFGTNRGFLSDLQVGDYLTYSNGDINKPWDRYDMTLVSAISADGSIAPVPEPGTCLLVCSGLFGVWGMRKRLT